MKLQTTPAQRFIGIDMIRTCAILFVIAGHFFTYNTRFMQTDFYGASMFLQGTALQFFYIGVPLFLLMTGYLSAGKKISWAYYKGGMRVLTAYLFFSVVTILFRKYHLGVDIPWTSWLVRISLFSAIPYGWYIGMWIGLFLLAPFLNILYDHIPTKKQKQLLILILFCISSIAQTLNRPHDGFYIVGNFWSGIYPFVFFFSGRYIREYRPVVDKRWVVTLLVGLCLLTPVANLLIFKGSRPLFPFTGPQAGAFVAIEAILFFVAVYQTTMSSLVIRSFYTSVALRSLDMYLSCYIVDRLVYGYFGPRYFESQGQFGLYFFIIVPLVFAGSFLAARLKQALFGLFGKTDKRKAAEGNI